MSALRRLSALLEDPAVTEIMVNGPSRVYAEKEGKLQLTGITFNKEDDVYALIEEILSPAGKQVGRDAPYAESRLPDGSRVHVIVPPVSLDGPMVTIRRFPTRRFAPEELVRRKCLNERMLHFLDLCVKSRRTIIVAGGTGSGKTALLNTLSSFINSDERIITIEDTAELKLCQPHVGRLEAASHAAGTAGDTVTMRDLLRTALRMRPDRILIGECRGAEAFDMLQAMNTGHEGCMTTIHANSPRECVRRVESMVLMAGLDLPLRAIREQLASAFHVIVFVSRGKDGARRITEITEITGMEGDVITMAPVFACHFKKNGQALFSPTGYVPSFIETLRSQGYVIEPDIFL